jgi:hypothetical protein
LARFLFEAWIHGVVAPIAKVNCNFFLVHRSGSKLRRGPLAELDLLGWFEVCLSAVGGFRRP